MINSNKQFYNQIYKLNGASNTRLMSLAQTSNFAPNDLVAMQSRHKFGREPSPRGRFKPSINAEHKLITVGSYGPGQRTYDISVTDEKVITMNHDSE